MNTQNIVIDVELEMEDKRIPDSPLQTGIESTFATQTHPSEFSESSSLDSFLAVKSKGFFKWYTNFPLSLKLILQAKLTLLSMLAIGIFLIVVQGIDTMNARNNLKYSVITSHIGKVIYEIQMERETANKIASLGDTGKFNSTETRILIEQVKELYVKTDVEIEKLKDYLLDPKLKQNQFLNASVSKMGEGFNLLKGDRQRLLAGNLDTTYTPYYYSEHVVKPLFMLFGNIISSFFEGNSLEFTYLSLLRAEEQEYQIKFTGMLAAMQSEMKMNRIRSNAKTNGIRDELIDLFLSICGLKFRNRYHSLISTQLLSNHKQQVEYLYVMAENATVPYTVYDKFNGTRFEELANQKLDAFNILANEVRNEIDRRVRRDLKQSVGLIVGVLVTTVFFFGLNALMSVLNGTTIVGPWKKLNLILANVCNNMIDSGFIRKIGIKSVWDLVLGHSKADLFTTMVVTIANHDSLIKGREPCDAIEIVNHYLTLVSAPIKNAGGVITSFSNGTCTAMFKDDGGASDSIKAARVLQNSILIHNQKLIDHDYSDSDDSNILEVGIGIDTRQTIFAVIGIVDRWAISEIGYSKETATLASKFSATLGIGTLISKGTLNSIQKVDSKKSMVNSRLAGFVKVQKSSGKNECVDVYEILNSGNPAIHYRSTFSKGVTKFSIGDYSGAIQCFGELGDQKSDALLKRYIFEVAQKHKERASYIKSLTIEDVLNNDVLCRSFKQYCEERSVLSVFELLVAIQKFKQLDLSADDSKTNLLECAENIYSKFMKSGSVGEVKLDFGILQSIEDAIKSKDSLTREVFDDILVDLSQEVNVLFCSFVDHEEFEKSFVISGLCGDGRSTLTM